MGTITGFEKASEPLVRWSHSRFFDSDSACDSQRSSLVLVNLPQPQYLDIRHALIWYG